MRDFLGEGLFGWVVGILPRQFNGFQNLEAENSSGCGCLGAGLRETQVQKLFPFFIHQFFHNTITSPLHSLLTSHT